MTAYATTAQAALIRKTMQSHVITDAERVGIERRLRDGFEATPSDCIYWLKTTLRWRKDDERRAAERQQGTIDL